MGSAWEDGDGAQLVDDLRTQAEELCPVHDHVTRVIVALDIPVDRFTTMVSSGRPHSISHPWSDCFSISTFASSPRTISKTGCTALPREEAVWKDIIRTNVLFNFVQQLKHIGILAAETRSHSGAINEYDAESKPWVLRQQG